MAGLTVASNRIATSPFRRTITLRHLTSNAPDTNTGKAVPVYSDIPVQAIVEPASGDAIRQFTDEVVLGRAVKVSIDHGAGFTIGTKDLLDIASEEYRIIAVQDDMLFEQYLLLAAVPDAE